MIEIKALTNEGRIRHRGAQRSTNPPEFGNLLLNFSGTKIKQTSSERGQRVQREELARYVLSYDSSKTAPTASIAWCIVAILSIGKVYTQPVAFSLLALRRKDTFRMALRRMAKCWRTGQRPGEKL